MYLLAERIDRTILTVITVLLVIGIAFSEGMSSRTSLIHIVDHTTVLLMLRVSAVWGAKASILWTLAGGLMVALGTTIGMVLVYIVRGAGQ